MQLLRLNKFLVCGFCMSIWGFSCNLFEKNTLNNEVEDSISLSQKVIKTNFKLSDYITDIHFLKLEQTNNSIIGEVNKIVEFGNKIYILDRYASSNIFVFNKEGKHLYNIGSIGKAPGQYIYPLDIFIDQINNQILVLDGENFRINYYSGDNGSFLFSTKLSFSAQRLFKEGDYYYFVGGRNNSYLIQTDKEFNIELQYFPREFGMKKLPHESFHKINDDLVLFQLNYKDTMYSLTNGTIRAYRHIDYGDKKLKYSNLQNLKANEDVIKIYTNKRITYRYYFENKTHIFLTFIENNKMHCVIYDKLNKSNIIFPFDEITNNISYEPYFPNIISTNDQGEFISIITPNGIINEIIKNKKNNSNSDVNSIKCYKRDVVNYEKYNYTNPIILYFKFNKISK